MTAVATQATGATYSSSGRWLRPAMWSAVWIPLILLLISTAVAYVTGVLTYAYQRLGRWDSLDSWTVITGAVVAMACAAPGCFLVVRKLSMMGDAISHAALPGIVIAFVVSQSARQQGWISAAGYEAWKHILLLVGAVVIGILCALGSELLQRLGRVEPSAALGVVFTTLFALGLLLMRLAADKVDLDPDCVLHGTLENVVLDLWLWDIPRAALVGGGTLFINLLLITLLFKEFRISAFDPGLATAMGIPAQGMHYLLMAITAVTLVVSFETVGSILVIAMLIVPGATASLLTDRLGWMIVLSLVIAAASALLGHILAVVLPPVIFGALGYPDVVDASTAGMMAAAAGLFFVVAMLFGPRYGVISKVLERGLLAVKMAAEDVLGVLYRGEERQEARKAHSNADLLRLLPGVMPAVMRIAVWRLARLDQLQRVSGGWILTDAGRAAAQRIIRAHRLWESYLARNYSVEDMRLHDSAERAEHFIDDWLREQLAHELETPDVDPHGRAIPSETAPPAP